MSQIPYMSIRHGSTLRFVEQAQGDTSGVVGTPTGYIVPLQNFGEVPVVDATQTPLTCTYDGTLNRWLFQFTDVLPIGRYGVTTKYLLVDDSVYVTEQSLLVIRP